MNVNFNSATSNFLRVLDKRLLTNECNFFCSVLYRLFYKMKQNAHFFIENLALKNLYSTFISITIEKQ